MTKEIIENPDEFDWMKASRQKRIEPSKALYRALRAVSDVTGEHIDILMDQAFGETVTLGTDYISNFRRGNIAAGRAMMIHCWLEQNHFDVAKEATPELFRVNPKSAWELFVEKHAKTDGLRIIPMKRQMGILSRARNAPKIVKKLRLGQCFCFELDSPINGTVVAFEEYRGKWHPLPLGADERRLRVLVNERVQMLPRDEVGNPIELEELHDTGQHQYVFVISTDKDIPITMKGIAHTSSETCVFITIVQFET
ncbi:hypothetical protein [Roseobacter sp.]|uniref:hypothetical protein n=1 Tax=Roseobacter sp. TaxID=1907202 RepID=UPI0029666841|nr:hypothetical protein [Roseobacter sp.]MDW3181634.1 hypothetical protein [Roseobacter sp.]